MHKQFHRVRLSHDMMKNMKPSKPRHLPWFGFKIVITLCSLSYFVFAYIKLHAQVELPSLYPAFHTSSFLGYHHHFEGTPKIAFLFLARRDLPLDFLWDSFFKVVWGESSMIEAEKLLLLRALHDPANQRFVLLSDRCVPLHNFSYIYSYLMSSPKSFVDSFTDVEEDRYSPKMSPVIPKDKWRKGSQRWPPSDIDNGRQILQPFVSDQYCYKQSEIRREK
ncbi:unnamed protein product [Dovyalis caffra]|uniref:Core-2/I-branching beta-1,6-N-acetylglucosaminyltransferase family protein n=1 Tax=Dovyalis caffra TaxID=77055 RepID=A0AAV1SDY2_9ROSI|nr:unnamed protein product [Dovyalis caffra]